MTTDVVVADLSALSSTSASMPLTAEGADLRTGPSHTLAGGFLTVRLQSGGPPARTVHGHSM